MIPDVKLNGKSVREMGWIRENIDFPTPQSQTNTIVVPGRNSPIRYTEALGRYRISHGVLPLFCQC